MMPMAPDLALDLGRQALGLGWTLGGVASVALAALLCVPVGVLVSAAVADALGRSPRGGETPHPQVATDGVVTKPAVSAASGLPRAA